MERLWFPSALTRLQRSPSVSNLVRHCPHLLWIHSQQQNQFQERLTSGAPRDCPCRGIATAVCRTLPAPRRRFDFPHTETRDITIRQGIFEIVRPLRRGRLAEIEQLGLQPIPILCDSVGLSFSLCVIITIFDISLSSGQMCLRGMAQLQASSTPFYDILWCPALQCLYLPSTPHVLRVRHRTASMAVAAPRQTTQTAQP